MPRIRIVGATIAFLGLALSLALAPASQARGPLSLGFSSDPSLTSPLASVNLPWIRRAVAEGGNMVRLNVFWSKVAPASRPAGFVPDDPASPGYHWSSI